MKRILNGSWHMHVIWAAVLIFVGCQSSIVRKPLKAPEFQAQAGSVDLAVLSVAPWDSCREVLQPAFKLTAEDALSLALPMTTASEQKLLDSVAAGLEVGFSAALPQGNSNSESGIRERASGVPSPASTNGLNIDPFARYLTATALYQEVQLLNRYINDAAFTEDWVPYLLRLQVSLMPKRRDLPVDAYFIISFFTEGTSRTSASMGPPPAGIRVIPLLVTDNLEALIQSSSAERMRQYALALAATYKGVGAKADVKKLRDEIQSAFGRDLNSTFTVARLCDNTIRCRFGASCQPQNPPSYGMIPQTHNVSVLVLVPRQKACNSDEKNRTVRICAKTSMVDVESGNQLKERSPQELRGQVRDLLVACGATNYNQIPEEIDRHMWKLIDLATENDFAGFTTELESLTTRAGLNPPSQYWSTHAFWTEFLAIRTGSQYCGATFVVPQCGNPQFDCEKSPQVVPLTIIDDGQTNAAITLTGAGLEPSELSAWLTITSNPMANTIPANSIKGCPTGKTIVISFPSLVGYKLVRDNGPTLPGELRLTVVSTGTRRSAGLATTLLPSYPCNHLLMPRSARPGA